jgi:hypothetical protein
LVTGLVLLGKILTGNPWVFTSKFSLKPTQWMYEILWRCKILMTLFTTFHNHIW